MDMDMHGTKQMHHKISSQDIFRCPDYYVPYSIRVYSIMSRNLTFNITIFYVINYRKIERQSAGLEQ
jgi:hypothetical protein